MYILDSKINNKLDVPMNMRCDKRRGSPSTHPPVLGKSNAEPAAIPRSVVAKSFCLLSDPSSRWLHTMNP